MSNEIGNGMAENIFCMDNTQLESKEDPLTSVTTDVQDCAVCLQKCYYPTQLPCGHIFCFLCVKGVALQSKKCAMCRAEIPPDYLDHPILLEKVLTEETPQNPIEEYQWYYEGRNGWWKYDQRSNAELEEAYNSGEGECKLLLAGALYVIDFQNMIQVQSRDQTRRRRVRRDTPTLPAKGKDMDKKKVYGIAGIKIMDNRSGEQIKRETEDSPSPANTQEEIIEILDDDSDLQQDDIESPPASSPNNSIGDVVQRMSSIDLQGQSSNHSEETSSNETP